MFCTGEVTQRVGFAAWCRSALSRAVVDKVSVRLVGRCSESRLRGRGQASEDSGDDVERHARNEALGTFAADIAAQLPGGAAGLRKKAVKKGKAKKKKR